MSLLRPLSTDASTLYDRRIAALRALLQLAADAADEHAAKQALNVSSYTLPNELARALSATGEALRALGVPQPIIDSTAATGERR